MAPSRLTIASQHGLPGSARVEPANLTSLNMACLPSPLFMSAPGSLGQFDNCQVLSLLGGMDPGKKPLPQGREERLREPENKAS